MPRASARSSSSALDDLGVGLGEELVDGAVPSAIRPLGELEREADPEQALLRAVVEVALEPPPLGVAGLDDARAGGAYLGELGAQLGLEARVLEREARGGARPPRRARARRASAGSWTSAATRSAVRARARVTARPVTWLTSSGLPAGIDVALVRGQPEGELERRIAERAGDRVAHVARVASSERSSTTRSATPERCRRVRRRPTRNAIGMAVKAPPVQASSMYLDLAAGGVHDQVRDEQKDRDGTRREHRGECATRRPARGSQLSRTSKTPVATKTPTMKAACDRVEDRRNGVQANDTKRVRRTIRARVVPTRVNMRTPIGARTSQAQYKPTTNRRSRLVSSRPLGNARKRCTVITSSRLSSDVNTV